MSDCTDIIGALKILGEDVDVPKSVKQKIELCIKTLESEEKTHIKLNRAVNSLEDLNENTNLQPMTRTALMGIISQMESKSIMPR